MYIRSYGSRVVEEGGDLTIPARTLHTIARKMGSKAFLHLTHKDDSDMVLIQSGLSDFHLPVISSEQFPNFELIDESVSF